MNLPKFPHSAMLVGVTACRKTKFLLKLLETENKNHFEFIIILCPAIQTIRCTFLGNGFLMINMFLLCVTSKGD